MKREDEFRGVVYEKKPRSRIALSKLIVVHGVEDDIAYAVRVDVHRSPIAATLTSRVGKGVTVMSYVTVTSMLVVQIPVARTYTCSLQQL